MTCDRQVSGTIKYLLKGNIKPEAVEDYLKTLSAEIGNTTDYRRLLCAYDYIKYSCD